MPTKYKGHTIRETSTTTDTPRGVRNVFEISDGPHSKRATARPFLTSITACREHINKEEAYQESRRNPTPEEIRAARDAAGLSQTAAALLIHSTMRTWQDWEAGAAKMHPGLWELFRAKVGEST